MRNQMAERLVRACLAKFEADRQEAITTIELFLNHPVAVADHPSIVGDLASAIVRLADAEEAIATIERNFIGIGDEEDE